MFSVMFSNALTDAARTGIQRLLDVFGRSSLQDADRTERLSRLHQERQVSYSLSMACE